MTEFENMGICVQLYFCSQHRGIRIFLHKFYSYLRLSYAKVRSEVIICILKHVHRHLMYVVLVQSTVLTVSSTICSGCILKFRSVGVDFFSTKDLLQEIFVYQSPTSARLVEILTSTIKIPFHTARKHVYITFCHS